MDLPTRAVPAFVVRRKKRWVADGLPDYPLWIAALIDSSALVTGGVVVVQRHDGNLVPVIGLAALALVPWVAELWTHATTWIAFVVLTGGSVLVLMTVHPVAYEWAPFLLILMAGHVTAVAGLGRGVVVTLVGEAVVVTVWLSGNLAGPEVGIWAAGIVVGLDMGFVLRSQQLRLDAQAREHTTRERQAVLEERHRIGREVHDLVAHSLSVTLLHLTAARREVEDAAGQGDVAGLDDAMAALRDAERVGRQAMTDIRGTVGLLGRGDEPVTAPAPGLDDLAGLVADFRGAGLAVDYAAEGDLAQVPTTTALGLYRIVQESLANVAKHAPGARVRVRLDVDGDPGELTVTSDLPRGARADTGGSGLSGMAERAAQLGAGFRAGPVDGAWVVRVDLPRGDAGSDGRVCPLPRLTAPFRRTAPGPA
ncbi:sensor histidine kinase [Nocardioides halotolerans]|uniref:sensor histidine kinase n=1 Tax=Nocardioides halotolerans TaxID=433660 RepID=UPI0003F8AD3F|nr:histidine kinase [Nocardioides halotolerans]